VAEVIYQLGYQRGLFQAIVPRAYLPVIMMTSREAPTPTPTPTVSLRQLVVNPSFESNYAWDLPQTSFPANYSTVFKRTGTRSMRLGINTGYNVFSYSSAQQVVFIAPGVSSAQLTFHYMPVTAALAGDRLYYYVLRTADNAELYGETWSEASIAWKQKSLDLLPFAGQYVTLRFGVKNDGLDGVTAAYLDDVEVWVTGGD
jgi:hypothetical protein